MLKVVLKSCISRQGRQLAKTSNFAVVSVILFLLWWYFNLYLYSSDFMTQMFLFQLYDKIRRSEQKHRVSGNT